MSNETTGQRINLGDTPLSKVFRVFEYYNRDNPNVNKALTIFDRSIALSRSTLSQSNIIANSKAFDIDVQVLLSLFKQFVELGALLGAIEPLPSLDPQDPIYSVY